MLTLFSIPKPFTGHDGLIQRNAICSWLALDPVPEIILAGNEEGIGDMVREFGLRWIPELRRTPHGTPLLDKVFRETASRARHPVLAYANADIIFTQSLMAALENLTIPDFLAVGRRTNIDLKELVSAERFRDFRFVRRLAGGGTLESPLAMDYFVFPKTGGASMIPPFAVGRPGWDNWMVYRAIRDRVPVIDLTPGVLVLHQNHGYGHVPQARGGTWEGPEADHNRRLAGSPDRLKYSLLDATHRYTPAQGAVAVAQGPAAWLKRQIADHPRLKWPLEALGFPWLRLERMRRHRLKKRGYP